jgi:hypothetical protein
MKKTCAAFLIFCVILNGSITTGAAEPAVTIQAPAIQASVFRVVSEMLVPFAVMADLFQKANPLRAEWKPASGNRDAGSPNDVYCFTAHSGKKTRKICRENIKMDSPDERSCSFPYISVPPLDTDSPCPKKENSGRYLYLFLLAYLVLLAKSNLPWSMLKLSLSPIPSCGIGFFYCVMFNTATFTGGLLV